MALTTAQIIQICILAAYLIILLVLGKMSTGQVKSNTDYLLSGRQMSWIIVAGGLVGTNFSGAVITSVSNYAYTYGLQDAQFLLIQLKFHTVSSPLSGSVSR